MHWMPADVISLVTAIGAVIVSIINTWRHQNLQSEVRNGQQTVPPNPKP